MDSFVKAGVLDLNPREEASLIWLALLFAIALTKADGRRAVGRLVSQMLAPKLATVFMLYAAWIYAFVILTTYLGIWRPELTKPTVVWATTTGVAMLFSVQDAAKPGFFRRKIREALGFVVLLEYVFTLAPFSLPVELIIQPVVALFSVAPLVARGDQNKRLWHRTSSAVLPLIGLIMVGHSIQTLYSSRAMWNWQLMALEAMWPVFLALWVLPYVWGFAVVALYEWIFVAIDIHHPRKKASWRPKLGIILALRLNLSYLEHFNGWVIVRVARANTLGDAYAIAQEYKARRTEELRREAEYQANLRRYAGSKEVDEKGLPRDRREFRETVKALRWLHTCQMGWYRREPVGYKPDLLDRLIDDFTRYGLPNPPGIHMQVSKDRKKWFAWRQTVGGHYFAIGAAEPPPDEWIYDGRNPPATFPGPGSEWVRAPYSKERAPNWYD